MSSSADTLSQRDSDRRTVGGKGVLKDANASKSYRATDRAPMKRHRKIVKDNIRAITKGDIRRIARRGGVKRISGSIYDDIRAAMKDHLNTILKDVVLFVDHRQAQTVTVNDVIFALKRIGRPIYGFDPNKQKPKRRTV